MFAYVIVGDKSVGGKNHLMAPNDITHKSLPWNHRPAGQFVACCLWSIGHALWQNSYLQGFVPYNHGKYLSPFLKF